MLVISEWMPNPIGNDTEGEWIELHNSGSEIISLAGYGIATSKSKPYIFSAQDVLPGQYIFLPRGASKLSLRNQDEKLTLFDPAGTAIDTTAFVGSAPEGKSFARVRDNTFLFSTPTPGTPNQLPTPVAAVGVQYPMGIPLQPGISGLEWILLAIAVGIGLTIAIMSIIGRNGPLSKLFFE